MRKALFWLCFVALNALAFSPAPYLPPLEIFDWWDKAQHAIAFGTLAVLAVLAFPGVSNLRIGLLLIAHGEPEKPVTALLVRQELAMPPGR